MDLDLPHISENPPSAIIVCPLIHSASGVHRKATTLAMSSGLPSLLAGVLRMYSSAMCLLYSLKILKESVSTAPPETQLTLICLGANSTARYLVKVSIAAF